jgi:hypothetical protein
MEPLLLATLLMSTVDSIPPVSCLSEVDYSCLIARLADSSFYYTCGQGKRYMSSVMAALF